MPPAYKRAFDAVTIGSHAAIAARRAGRAAAVGRFESSRGQGDALCVVADDRPGLLATISAALVLSELDVTDAEAYTRRTPAGRFEAVDVFWVRPSSASPPGGTGNDGDAAAARVESTLIELLEGKREYRAAPVALPAAGGGHETTVRFIESDAGDLATLEVETGDRSGLLLALANALFAQRVQIVGSEVRTKGGRVFDRFQIVELDGSPIGPERRLMIQVAVLSAVQPV